jgi:hypothetical protein
VPGLRAAIALEDAIGLSRFRIEHMGGETRFSTAAARRHRDLLSLCCLFWSEHHLPFSRRRERSSVSLSPMIAEEGAMMAAHYLHIGRSSVRCPTLELISAGVGEVLSQRHLPQVLFQRIQSWSSLAALSRLATSSERNRHLLIWSRMPASVFSVRYRTT